MSGTFKKIKQKDFSSIEKIEFDYLIHRIEGFKNNEKLYKILFNELVNNIDDLTLIEYIYDVECLDKYTHYLINRNINNICKIKLYILDYLISNTSWGKSIFLDNIDEIYENQSNLISYFYKNEQLCLEIFNAFKIKKNKLAFLTCALSRFSVSYLSEEDILSALYNGNSKDFSISDNSNPKFVPNDIGSLLLEKSDVNNNYRKIAEKYSKSFFDSAKESKISFINLLKNDPNNLKAKYKVSIELYIKSNYSNRTDMALSNLIRYGDYHSFSDDILRLSPDLDIHTITIESTTTSNVFKINNTILKLGRERFNCNINTNFFRIIPCKITYIRDFSGKVCAVTELEDEIDTNPDHIDTDMIYELFLDFKNNGLCIYDPRCLLFDKSNFGLLKSYKDANLGEYNNHDCLPENFKKNPLVLLDVDLIYKYGEKVVLPFASTTSMDEAIEMYEEGISKRKVKL